MRPSYARRLAAHICTACGQSPAHPGRIDCDDCRFAKARYYDPTLTREVWDEKEAQRAARYNPLEPRVFPHQSSPSTDPLALRRIPGPALLHCGEAWPITPDQVACGACGQAYTEEAS